MSGGDQADLLVVDDDLECLRALSELLTADGYRVLLAPGAREALRMISAEPPDCVVLDYAMPEMTGLELLRTLRELGRDVPVVMLSAKSDSYDKVSGYSSGADVYVGKDEDPGVLRAAVRRMIHRRDVSQTRIELGGLMIDVATWTCTVDGHPVALPRRLFRLLHALASQPGRVLRKEQLLYQVWGIHSDIYYRAVDNAIVELRRGIGDSSIKPRFVHTVRGVGYKFEITP